MAMTADDGSRRPLSNWDSFDDGRRLNGGHPNHVRRIAIRIGVQTMSLVMLIGPKR
jgi:hypothetical protein